MVVAGRRKLALRRSWRSKRMSSWIATPAGAVEEPRAVKALEIEKLKEQSAAAVANHAAEDSLRSKSC